MGTEMNEQKLKDMIKRIRDNIRVTKVVCTRSVKGLETTSPRSSGRVPSR